MPGMPLSENDIETCLVRHIKKKGGLCLKFVSPSFTGVPDRIVLMPGGKLTFVELKAPGKELRPRQKFVKRQLEALGFIVLKIDSKEQVYDL